MECTIELSPRHVNRQRLTPSRALVEQIARAVVRRGDAEVPGLVLIPDTRRVVGSLEAARAFQASTMGALLRHLWATDAAAVRVQPYVQLHGREAASYYRRSILTVDDTWKIFPGTLTRRQGGGTWHFDDLRTIVSSLAYRGKHNAVGGSLEFMDLLRFARDRGRSLEDLVWFRLLSEVNEEIGGYRSRLCPLELCAWPTAEAVRGAKDYTVTLPLEHHRYPLVIFTNRITDGLVHRSTSVRRRRRGRPHWRRFTFVNILHADPWQVQP